MKNCIAPLLIAVTLSAAAAAERRVELAVPDMNCPACPVTIRKSLERLGGVSVESASLESKRVVVRAPDAVSDDVLLSAVRDAGFSPSLVPPPEK
jgi:mercuric ion binding protein